MLYAFFWVIPPASEFYVPTFRNTLFHLHSPMKMEQTECSETSAYKIQTPGNNPEESIQHSVHGESLKSRGVKPTAVVSLLLMLNMCIAVPMSWWYIKRGANFTNVVRYLCTYCTNVTYPPTVLSFCPGGKV